MPHLDLSIYAVHAAFWSSFGVTRSILRWLDRGAVAAPANTPTARQGRTAPFSRTVLAVHVVAFFVMYLGVRRAAIPGRVPEWFPGQRAIGTLVIACGAALMSWALVSFRSWRIRAKLDEGHELTTGGPFSFLRHPIYMGLNLLALGTAIWIPTAIVWVGFVLILLASDLRARTEETLLEEEFGPSYRAYRARTRRFVPGIY